VDQFCNRLADTTLLGDTDRAYLTYVSVRPEKAKLASADEREELERGSVRVGRRGR
jgi:hypothetical protein